jgi:hypothetical protein
MAKKGRLRTERRVRERAARQIVRDRHKLATLEVGGSRERPIDVVSPSVIAVRARSLPCPLCGGTLRLDEETAETFEGKRLRAAHVTCVRCGVARVLWFSLSSPLPN